VKFKPMIIKIPYLPLQRLLLTSLFATVFGAISLLTLECQAQPIDAKGRYQCLNQNVLDTTKNTQANVKKLRKRARRVISRINIQLQTLVGNSPAIKKNRAKLQKKRQAQRLLLKRIKECLSGVSPIATATPTAIVGSTTPIPTATPTLTPTPGVAKPQIAAGFDHSCVLSSSGVVRCYGDNSFLQAGVGQGVSIQPTPIIPVGLSSLNFTSIDAGARHSCASAVTGGIYCWGFNTNSQVTGDGGVANVPLPALVVPATGSFVQVVGGDRHTCAVQPSGSVVCWGQNNSGECGNGSIGTIATPLNVQGLSTTVTKIATFSRHTCAVLGNGGVQCWGLNSQGQLGFGGSNFNIAQQATAPNGLRSNISIIDVAPGSDHTCVLYLDGVVQCVGQNDLGQVGNGTTSNQQMSWATTAVSNASAIASGEDFSCAIVNNRTAVSCWGKGISGQLGNGAFANSTSPVSVQGLTGSISTISAGRAFACAANDSGSVFCWGDNNSNQFGFTSSAQATAVEVVGLNLNN
jgi:alpha-tubulin suppressor-like RCC1 family protein